jgi:hypothetical protein
MIKELIVVKGQVIEQNKSYSPEVGKNIGYEAGAKMVKNHFDQHSDDVMASYIGKNIILNILSQPDCVGLRAFNGLDDMGIRRLIYVGVDKNGRNIIDFKIEDQKHVGIVAGGTIICPPYCGDSGSGSLGW